MERDADTAPSGSEIATFLGVLKVHRAAAIPSVAREAILR